MFKSLSFGHSDHLNHLEMLTLMCVCGTRLAISSLPPKDSQKITPWWRKGEEVFHNDLININISADMAT